MANAWGLLSKYLPAQLLAGPHGLLDPNELPYLAVNRTPGGEVPARTAPSIPHVSLDRPQPGPLTILPGLLGVSGSGTSSNLGSLLGLLALEEDRGAAPDAGAAGPPAPETEPELEPEPEPEPEPKHEPEITAGQSMSKAEFIDSMMPLASDAADRIGVDPAMLVAQAGLETGWGKRMMNNNLFGIKAGSGRKGAGASTIEYVNGKPVRMKASFRAYSSPEESFADYADLITKSKRYRNAVEVAGDPQAYAWALKEGGYATDPAYARKMISAYNSIIGLQDGIRS